MMQQLTGRHSQNSQFSEEYSEIGTSCQNRGYLQGRQLLDVGSSTHPNRPWRPHPLYYQPQLTHQNMPRMPSDRPIPQWVKEKGPRLEMQTRPLKVGLPPRNGTPAQASSGGQQGVCLTTLPGMRLKEISKVRILPHVK